MAPRRRGKKGSLQSALEVCVNSGRNLTLFDDKYDIDLRERKTHGNSNPIEQLKSNPEKQLIALCDALHSGNHDLASQLIQAGTDVNLALKGRLPLSFALGYTDCSLQIVIEIIAAGFPKNGIIELDTGRTSLHSAVMNNHHHIVEYLFTLNVDPNVRDIFKQVPMHYAVEKNDFSMVELLVKNSAKLDLECQNFFTPMFSAIVKGQYDMVKLLLTLGADIHYVKKNNSYPLMPLQVAAALCQFKILHLLIDKGADVNKVHQSTGMTALHAAACADTHNEQQRKVALDCIVELLIKSGSKIDAIDRKGCTPLQLAIQYKSIDVANILIVKGSQLNNVIKEDNKKCTTFHLVSSCFDIELLRLCFDYGADANAKDEEGLYPLHYALMTAKPGATSYSASIIKLFWTHNFPIDLPLSVKLLGKYSPPIPKKIISLLNIQKLLFVGLRTLQVKVVQQAIAQGAEVQCCSTDIPYPLHYISSKGDENIMKIFLSRGMHPNSLDEQGETPLHVAAKNGFVNCCRYLLEYGAVYNCKSSKCLKTPLQFAKDNGHTEVVTLLTTVGKHFKELGKKKFKKLNPDMTLFMALMNCCGSDGMTLMGRALHLGLKDFAQHLMKLRLQMVSE